MRSLDASRWLAVRNSRGVLLASALTLMGIVAVASQPCEAQVRIAGHVPARAVAQARPIGPVAGDESIRLAFVLPARNQAELADLVRGLYDPADPRFGRYLTPAEFARRFGPAPEDYDAVAAFARHAGLKVAGTYSNRTVLDVEGSATAVERAFALHLNQYRGPDGRVFRAPDTDPLLPAGIASRVSGIAGLDTLAVAHPHIREPLPAAFRDALAPLQIGTGPGNALAPTDITSAYALNTVTRTGAGQTLAVFELDGYTASDISAYTQYFHLPSVPVQPVLVGGVTGLPSSGGGPAEVTLDIELQIALAPGASGILVYEGPNTLAGVILTYDQIATDNLAQEISTSWGIYEAANPGWFLSAENTAFQQMAVQGQSIYAAAGDTGAYDNYGYVSPATLSADDPAAQPYMVGVGGTTLSTNGAGGTWKSETVWNRGSPSSGAGGGGISGVWQIPPYQAGVVTTPSLGSSTMRNVPDVALEADPNTGYAVFYKGAWKIYGGTSCASPLWAAFTALVNEQRLANGKPTLGFANPAIYQIAQSASYASDFHDIADGRTNLFYPTVTGYDLATGWGSFVGVNLLADLAAWSPTVAKQQTTLGVDAVSGQLGSTITLSAHLTAGTTPVSGKTVTFTVGTTAAGSATTDATGTASVSFTIPVSFGGGTQTIGAAFAGDGAYFASSGSNTLTCQKLNTALAVDSASGQLGSTVTLSAHLTTGSSPLSGKSVSFTVGTTAAGSATTDATGTASVSFTIPVSFGGGTQTIAASFAADAAYFASSGSNTLTCQKLDTALAVDSASGQLGSTVTLSARLTSGSSPLSGKSVSFTVGTTAAGSASTDATGTASVSFTIPVSLGGGTQTISATFVTDTTYSGATGSNTLTCQKLTPTLVVDAAAGQIGTAVTLSAHLTSGSTAVSGKSLSFTVGGLAAGTATTNSTGTGSVSYAIPIGTTGNPTIAVSFDGTLDPTYASSTGSSTLTVSKRATKVSASAASGAVGETVTLSGTLRTVVGSTNVSGKALTFSVGGAAAGTATTNASGVASVAYVIPTGASGPQTIQVAFADANDPTYATSSATSTLTINAKRATKVSASAASGAVGETIALGASLHTVNGGLAVAGKVLTFSVAGTVAGTATTSVTGSASLPYVIPTGATGAETITVAFADATDPSYATSSANSTLTVTAKRATRVSVTAAAGAVGETITLSASLRTVNGSILVAGKPLTFSVAGVVAGTVATSAAGSASLAYVIPTGASGTQTITVAFADTTDPTYATSSATATLTITAKRPTRTSASTASGAAGETVTLSGSLRTVNGGILLAGKVLTFSVAGTVVGTATTSTTGSAIVPYVIPTGASGAQTITVAFADATDATYATSSATATLTITAKRATKVTASSVSGTAGAVVTLIGTLRTVNGSLPVGGKALSFTVAGSFVGSATTNASGVATVPYTIPTTATGTQTITVAFSDTTDPVYATSSASATLTIKP